MPEDVSAIRLMLILPAGFPAEDAAPLARAADIAAVIAMPGTDGPQEAARLGAITKAFQTAGAAVIVDGRADLARTLDLDGAHLGGTPALKAALPTLKPGKIAGAGGLATRHEAMEAGEMGADYVLFGDLEMPFSATLEAVEWWAEVFEVPCVGVATSVEEAEALARAGADFVALAGPAATVDALDTFMARLTEAAQ